uniref:Metalloendopeptidase n=1 Tax=Strongyloides papillosus TaxID=174720 RepID=A0A0N5C2U1_STREA
MENSGYYQGDIKLSKLQAEYLIDTVAEIAEGLGADVSDIIGDAETRKKRKIDTRPNFIWDLKVPYVVDYRVDRNLIRKALDKLQSETCLEFIEYSGYIPSGEAGLKYFPGDGCYSNVGRQSLNELQEISIGPGCNFIPTIQHETMHIEIKYLKILINNVKDFAIENFLKLQLTDALDYGVPYDYGSAMHYNSHSFSKNGQPTMLPYIPMYEKTIGSKSEATFLDIMVLNLYYCEDICLNRITCKNNGYQDPNSCERCKCLKGFTGRDCSEIERNSLCENQELFADGTQKLLYVDGEKDCVYHIISKSRNKFRLK